MAGRISHDRSFHKINKLHCQNCQEEFENKIDLENHQCEQNPPIELHKCNICAKSFLKLQHEAEHIGNMHANHQKESKNLEKSKGSEKFCTLCFQVFQIPEKLYEHLQNHHENNHKCGYCDKSFETSDLYRTFKNKYRKQSISHGISQNRTVNSLQ